MIEYLFLVSAGLMFILQGVKYLRQYERQFDAHNERSSVPVSSQEGPYITYKRF